jgi:cGMP-dependent protein kinase
VIILSQRDPKNDDYEEENALVDNQFKTKTNKLEIKKSVNSSEISSDSKKDNRGLEKKNNKLLNVSKSKDNNKGAELNTNVNTNSKGVNESSATAEKKFGSTLLLNSGVSKEAYKLTNAEKDFIRQTLVQHFLFKDTNNKIITSLINLMEIERLQPNQVLYEEKSVGDKFFIVKEGILEETFKNNSQPKLYREGETFGELALLEKRKRDGTMTCKENATLYSLKGLLFRNIVDKMNKEEQKERIAFLSLVPIFQSINKNQLNNIVLNMFTCTFESGQVICKEGETGYSFYIIKSGNVNCESKSGELKRILQPKDFFGEYAVLFDMPRSLNVRAKSKVILYKISTALLEESLGPDYRNIILKSILRESLLSSKHLSLMANISYYNEIYQKTNTILFNNDQQVPLEEYSNTNDEEDNRILYCIISGNFVQKLNNDEKKIITKRGQLFGEEYLENKNKNSLKKNNIYAEGECRVLKLLVKDALKVMNIKLKSTKKIISFFEHLNCMLKTEMFRNTSINKIIQICSLMKKEKFDPNEYIFEKGDVADKFYVIKKGAVIVWNNDKRIRELEKGNCFGELALLSKEPRSATLQAKDYTTLYVLEKNDFINNIDKKLLEYLNVKMSLLDDFNMSLKDFYFCKNLGQGKFGEVSLVHNNKHFYAIKCVDRKEAEKQKHLIKYFLEERRVLLELDHPFIMKLIRTFKTKENIFYLTNFINGKGLGKHLETKKEKTFRNKEETRFYISFLFVILDYLNSKGIAHRDLKPENIMINTQGYLQLIDFGTAKRIKDFTSTIIGTAYYISPEILTGKGYSYSCDYWSVGIITFEIYYNYYPFGNEANDPMEVYREVLKKDLSLPYNGDATVNSFIKAVLNKKVSKRLSSLEAAKKHALFKDFNWNDLIDFTLKAPYVPESLELKSFGEYNVKYIDHLKTVKRNRKESIVSIYDDNDNHFSNNWADEF